MEELAKSILNTHTILGEKIPSGKIKQEAKMGIDSVLNGLNKFGLANLSLEERISKLKGISFDEFMRFIIFLRKSYGSIKIENKSDSFKVKKELLEDNIGTISLMWVTDYYGPRDPYNTIKKVYENIQKEINMDNYKEQITILYYALILSQMFNDGNGRTALGIHNYFTQEEINFDIFKKHEEKKSGSFNLLSGHKKLIYEVMLKSIGHIYKTYFSTDKEPSFLNSQEVKDGKFGVKIFENGKPLVGNDSFLRFFAASFILLKRGGFNLSIENIIDINSFSPAEKKKYEELYKELNSTMFSMYLEEVKKNMNYYSSRVEELKKEET